MLLAGKNKTTTTKTLGFLFVFFKLQRFVFYCLIGGEYFLLKFICLLVLRQREDRFFFSHFFYPFFFFLESEKKKTSKKKSFNPN